MVEHLLEVIQRPHVLRDRVHPQKESNVTQSPKSSQSLQYLLDRVRMRKWVYAVHDDLMEAIIELRHEVKFIEHLPGCWLCKMELQLDVERYLGNHSFWYVGLENSEYLERRYRSCPRERDYVIPSYWEQVQYYREHGGLGGMENTTVQFILDRAKWAYRICGKQIRLARRLLRMVRNWNFSDPNMICEFNRVYERLGMYDVALPFEV